MNKHLPWLRVEVKPAKDMRYATAGDYETKREILADDIYYIAKLPLGWRAELAVFVHEIVEYQLCKEAGIKEPAIMYFDTHEGKDSDDPGTMKSAPYREQHMIADKIDRYIVKTLGLDYKQYDADFSKLKYTRRK